MTDKRSDIIRQEILEKAREYYSASEEETVSFRPGIDMIPFAGRVYDENELASLIDSALDFWLTAGKYAKQFEREYAEYFGLKHCMLVNSGSSANLLALTVFTSPKLGDKALNPGDEVITAAACFPTTVNPIIQNNLVPVFVDTDIGTYNVNPDNVREAVTPKTKAIMLAHTLGNPFDLDEVTAVAGEHDLYLIEDCCDAVGSTYKGKMVGTFGHTASVSFYPAHHMTMGEGGAVLADSDELARIVCSLRDWGRDCFCEPGKDNTCGHRFTQQFGDLPLGYDHKYVYSHIGYNLKVLDLQAAIGVEQLKKLPAFIEKRKNNFKLLQEGLEQFNDDLVLPQAASGSDPSWFAFPISVKQDSDIQRGDLVAFLESRKIQTRMLFAGNIIRHPAYRNVKYRIAGTLENTDFIMNNTFFIGVYPGITEEMIEYIVKAFKEYFEKHT